MKETLYKKFEVEDYIYLLITQDAVIHSLTSYQLNNLIKICQRGLKKRKLR